MAKIARRSRALSATPLSNPALYSLVQRALGAHAVRTRFVTDHLRPTPGERILDLGCGPGDILTLLPPVDYVGVDASPSYVAAARERFGDRATFRCADVRGLDLGGERFDAAIAIGLLHHLDDAGVDRTIGAASEALGREGRLVTLDPGRAPGQGRAARWLVERDRGRYVRSAAAYRDLVSPHFGSVEVAVRHDLARVPYTHVILECRGPAPAGAP